MNSPKAQDFLKKEDWKRKKQRLTSPEQKLSSILRYVTAGATHGHRQAPHRSPPFLISPRPFGGESQRRGKAVIVRHSVHLARGELLTGNGTLGFPGRVHGSAAGTSSNGLRHGVSTVSPPPLGFGQCFMACSMESGRGGGGKNYLSTPPAQALHIL